MDNFLLLIEHISLKVNEKLVIPGQLVSFSESNFEFPCLSKRGFDYTHSSLLRDHTESHKLPLSPLHDLYRSDVPPFLQQIRSDHLRLRNHSIHARDSLLRFEDSQRTEGFSLGRQCLDDLRVEGDATPHVHRCIQLTADQQGAERRVDGLLQLQQRPDGGYESGKGGGSTVIIGRSRLGCE